MFGSKVVALSDSQGGIYNPDGLVPDAVLEYKEKPVRLMVFLNVIPSPMEKSSP